MNNLMPGAGAPLILHVGANALLFAHIAGGSAAILAGYAAVAVRKGGKAHAVAGNAFFAAMLTMTGVAMVTAPFLEAAWTNTTAAVFTMYLVGTAWMAVKRRPGAVGRFERLVVAVPVGIALMALTQAILNAGTPRMAGFTSVFVFGAICVLAAACDLSMVRRGGLVGPARTARHLWRMCASFFVATGSFFFGQAQVLPEAWRGSPPIVILGAAPLGFLVFWMVRVRVLPALRRRRARPAVAA